MLTAGQIRYLATIPDNKKMVVKPFNPKGLDVANQIIADIKSVEPDLEIILLGSLPLKISGQEDIDISAFCIKSEQPKHFDNFKRLFGEPTRQGKNSTGWDFQKDEFSVSVWLSDPTAETTKAQVEVFNLLKSHPALLREYEKIKEKAKDFPYKEYQRKKYEFYNRILKEFSPRRGGRVVYCTGLENRSLALRGRGSESLPLRHASCGAWRRQVKKLIEIIMPTTKTEIASSKGKLAAAIHYPETPTDRLAILCPGYLDSKDYQHLVSLAEILCQQGYTVVRFDPTGTWVSDGNIADYTHTQYLKDIKSVVEYMLQQAHYQHVLLGGHSRGGQMALLYAARDPRISLVLGIMPSFGPVTGHQREEWEKTGISVSRQDLPDNPSEKREFRVPFSHVQDRDRYDVISDVKNIDVPIILIAGERDEQVLPADVKEIYDNANEPKKFIVIPDIGHDYRHHADQIKAVNKIILEQINNA